jgi:hypothetical protein
LVTNNDGKVSSGLSQYDSLVDWERAGKKRIHYTVYNYINWSANPLHMNGQSFENNCNVYIFTPVRRCCLLCWNPQSSCRVHQSLWFHFISLSLKLVFPGCRWLEWILQSTIQKCSNRIDTLAVVCILILGLHHF